MASKLNKPNPIKFLLLALILMFQQYGCRSTGPVENNKDLEFPNDPLVDKSFITGQPCEAPCWHNLYLEVSTIDDIRATLVTIPFIDSSKTLEQKIGQNTDEIMFLLYCTYGNPSEGCIYLQTSPEGKLSSIYLIIYYSLTIEEVIETLGKPTYYISEPRPSGNMCVITLYWTENFIVAHAEDKLIDNICPGRDEKEIRLDIQIHDLVYGKIISENLQRDGLPWP